MGTAVRATARLTAAEEILLNILAGVLLPLQRIPESGTSRCIALSETTDDIATRNGTGGASR